MDVDEDTVQQSTSSQLPSRTRIIVPVDDAHPFDLEGYISNYSGSYPGLSYLEHSNSYTI
jgi:COP9 signalosome complex subunit 1